MLKMTKNKKLDCDLTKNKDTPNNYDSTVVESDPSVLLSKFGMFQIRSLIMISILFANLGAVSVVPVFVNIIPEHECKTKDVYDSANFRNVSDYKLLKNASAIDGRQCSRIVYNETLQLSSSVNSTENRERCANGWIFNLTEGNTAVSQFGLVCESGWKRPLTISSTMFGMLLANIYGGHLSDRYGRKMSAIAAVVAHAVASVIISLSPSYWFYTSFLLLNGFTRILMYMYAYIWSQELVYSSDKRAMAALALNVMFSVGEMSTSLIGYFVREWSWMYRVFAVSFAINVPLLWTVPESPIWLMQSKYTEKAEKVLKQISKTNKIKISSVCANAERQDSSELTKKNNTTEKISSIILWKNKILRRRMIIMCLLWNYTLMSFFTNALNSANLGGNVYINNLIGGGFDVVAAVAVTVLVRKFNRRHTMVFSVVMLGSLSILSQLVKQANQTAGTILVLVSRCFSTISYMLVYLITGEYFPTLLRNTSISIASLSSRFGSMAAPFLIYAGEEINLSIPFYVIGGLAVVSIYLTLLLPETSHIPLPNTLDEAVNMKDPKWIPLCKRCDYGCNHDNERPRKETRLNASSTGMVNDYAI